MGLKNSILMQRFNVGGLYLIDVYVGKIRLTITGMTVAGTFLMDLKKKIFSEASLKYTPDDYTQVTLKRH